MYFDTHQHLCKPGPCVSPRKKCFTFHHLTQTHHLSKGNTNLLNRTHAKCTRLLI